MPAAWSVTAPIQINLYGLNTVQQLTLYLCNGCKTELQYQLTGRA